MRIALACDWFLKYASAQAAALARQGAEVTLVCRGHAHEFGGDPREHRAVVGRARAAGVEVHELPARLWDPMVAGDLWRIRGRLARFRPEIVHVHDRVDPRALALLPRAPSVLTIHDPEEHPGQPVAPAGVKRWVLEGARRAWRTRARIVIVHSDSLNREIELGADQRSVVVPHGLEVRPEPLSPPPVPTVGFFGRLQPYKGLDVLARAMPRVWEIRPDVRLNVVGSGPSPLPLSDPRVRFEQTYLPESQVEDFFSATSLAVLPYTQASQTGAGSLAIGFGVPVVASRVGGLPDLVLDGTYLFEAGDDAGLAATLLRHIDDGADVRSRVLKEVAGPKSWDSTARLSLELYRQLSVGR